MGSLWLHAMVLAALWLAFWPSAGRASLPDRITGPDAVESGLQVSPASLSVTVGMGREVSRTLTLTNPGSHAITFHIKEVLPAAASDATASQGSFVRAPMVVDQGQVTVEPVVLARIAAQGQADFWVQMRQRADLAGASAVGGRERRGAYVYDSLRMIAEDSQAGVRAYLDGQGVSYGVFWVDNSLLVRGGTAQVVQDLAARSDVRLIRAPRAERFNGRPRSPYIWLAALPVYNADPWSGTAWGVTFVGADLVWSQYGARGAGIVVASIDTGVQWDHPALKHQYRGWNGASASHDYNWYAPTESARGACPGAAQAPCDWSGHGTHTMGTMVGDDGVAGAAGHRSGVAPAARWLAAMGCDDTRGYCSDEALALSAEWMLAPCPLGKTPGDPACQPDLRPDIINNSWGNMGGATWYQPYVTAWRAAGIFPSFTAGNEGSGPSCGSVVSPGDYPESFASGAIGADYFVPDFSGRGPGIVPGAGVKPDLVAPGINVCSTVPGNGYDCNYSGTSMAAPHTSGAVALMWSARPALRGNVTETMNLLRYVANPSQNLGVCGRPASDPTADYSSGYGYLDARAAVEAAITLPWVNAQSAAGMVEAHAAQAVQLDFGMARLAPGVYGGTLTVDQDDPNSGPVSIPLTLTVVAYGAQLTPTATAGQGPPGTVVTYTVRLQNLGTGSDSFYVQFQGTWASGAAAQTVGPLGPGNGYDLPVPVPVPARAAAGTNDVTLVTARSQGDDTRYATAVLTTTATAVHAVRLLPQAAGGRANPGETLTHTLRVTNTGNVTETYRITVQAGWATTAPQTTGPLAPGQEQNLSLQMTVPVGTVLGSADTATVTVAAQAQPAAFATARVTTVAGRFRSWLPVSVRH